MDKQKRTEHKIKAQGCFVCEDDQGLLDCPYCVKK